MGTLADIFVNAHKIGSIDNIYRTYYFDIPEEVLNRGTTGLQRLRIDIKSTVR
jgi:beta-galactosidase/beta-glucuronidase